MTLAGAGVLANAMDQTLMCRMIRQIRQQAGSHEYDVGAAFMTYA